MSVGQLLYDGKWIYSFTKTDRDTLVRCLYGESGADACADGRRDGLAVLTCMINRWAMLLTLPWYRRLLLAQPEAKVYGYDSFDDFLHAYSQPINYAWLNGGKFDRDLDHVDGAEKRRSELLERKIDLFPRSIRDLVDSALCFAGSVFSTASSNDLLRNGVSPDMAGLVHFFCPAIYYARKLGMHPRKLTPEQVDYASRKHVGNGDAGLIWSQPAATSPRSNAFYKVKRTRRWDAATVSVRL